MAQPDRKILDNSFDLKATMAILTRFLALVAAIISRDTPGIKNDDHQIARVCVAPSQIGGVGSVDLDRLSAWARRDSQYRLVVWLGSAAWRCRLPESSAP
jgi:hypothetical protein